MWIEICWPVNCFEVWIVDWNMFKCRLLTCRSLHVFHLFPCMFACLPSVTMFTLIYLNYNSTILFYHLDVPAARRMTLLREGWQAHAKGLTTASWTKEHHSSHSSPHCGYPYLMVAIVLFPRFASDIIYKFSQLKILRNWQLKFL